MDTKHKSYFGWVTFQYSLVLISFVLFGNIQNSIANKERNVINVIYYIECEAPVWSASETYVAGNKVSFNGVLYEAKWWNQNKNPETHSGRDDEWKSLGSCDGGGNGDGNVPPTVSLTAPLSGETFTIGDSININANTSDQDGQISKIEFYIDGNKIGEDLTAPHTIDWVAMQGHHSITAIAIDDSNASSTSDIVSITVQEDTGGGTDCDTPQYSTGSNYIAGSTVQNDGSVYECKPWPFSGWCNGIPAAYAPGTGTNWEDAWILIGDCNPDGDNGEPLVSITSPSDGQSFVEGNNTVINVSATDKEGTITKVEFFSNGDKIGEDTSDPYSFTLNNLQIGNYALTAKATDNENLSSISKAVNIRVTSSGGGGPMPTKILNGYWHNFQNGSGLIRLRDVSSNWDVINVSFAEPKVSSTDGELGFELAPEFSTINYTENDFKSDIQYLKGIGKKVIISIGGAEGQVRLNTVSARDKFVNSMITIIEEYDFDGMDIDFEGQSLSLDLGDDDFKNPTTPVLVNTISAVTSVCNHFGNDFLLTMAPETFFVQLGYSFYGGISQGADRRAGAYLPLIHALRDKITFLQVQYYNSGSITGLDDRFYSMGNSDFYVALVDMLLKGFPITGDSSKFFPALRPDQILIGVPATVNAGGGFTGAQGVISALDYLIKGNSFGGQYQLSKTYPGLRGVMSWSVNWDQFGGFAFSNPVRTYLDGLSGKGSVQSLDVNFTETKIIVYPNPIDNYLNLQFTSKIVTGYTLKIYDSLGTEVTDNIKVYNTNNSNLHKHDLSILGSGIYFYKIKVNDETYTGRIIKK